MARKMLVADLLCGAGGSSTGCAQALAELGLEMDLVCVNHWPVAIDTHTRNHPTARHYVQDISTVRPHLIVPEGYLDLLMASPTCTHHSVARGGKPTSDQQRSDPWHILTWFTELRVKRAIIENVWEFISWGPVDARTGKPIQSRKGEYFKAWVNAIWALGATSIEYRKLNAADFGDATSRQRFIMMIRFDGKQVAWPMPTHRKREDGRLELFPGMRPWRPAREIIDWSIKGRSIFGRKKDLAPKTLARIYAGALKFGWPEPYLVILRNHMDGKSVDGPLPAIAAEGNHIGLAEPIIVSPRHGKEGAGPRPRTVGQPLPTITAGGSQVAVAEPVLLSQHNTGAPRSTEDPLPALTTGGAAAEDHPGCARPMLAEPVVVNMKGRSTTSDVKEPLPTQTSQAAHLSVVEPVIVNGRRNNKAKAVSVDPLPALDTKGGVWLAEPFVATVAHGNSEGDQTADTRRAHSVDDPLGAIPGSGGTFAVVEPFVLSQGSGGAPRSADEPVPTIPTDGAHALISPYYGSGSGETSQTVEVPLPTVTAKGRFGVVVPVTQSGGGPGARDVETEPLATMTTAKGGEFAVVVPVTHAGGGDRVLDPGESPLPAITGANRGELAFITAQHGEREGQAPRVHDIGDPTPAIAASGHVDLVEPDGERYDILFRMLEPHELAAAMGFDDYEFAGTKTEKIKQIGNAVSVKKMKACVGALMLDAVPKRAKAPRAAAIGKAA